MTVFSERRRRLLMASDGGTQVVNYTMLYDAGNECVDVTGGWGIDGYSWSNGTLQLGTKSQDGYMAVDTKKDSTSMRLLATQQEFNFSEYVKTGILAKAEGSATNRVGYVLASSKTNPTSGGVVSTEMHPTSKGVYVCDIGNANASLTTSYALIYGGYASSSTTLYLYNAWVVKQDDWQTLCEKAGLNPASYADEAALCADASAMATILGNSAAVRYMVSNCTGSFMAAFIASSTALSAYSASAYKDVIDTNLHWAKFLAMVL